MKVIYLDGPPSVGKTTRAREIQKENPGKVVRIKNIASLNMRVLADEAAYLGLEVASDDLIVVVDPDGQPLPAFEFEIERFTVKKAAPVIEDLGADPGPGADGWG